MSLEEQFIGTNQEIEQLQQDYELYNMFLSKVNQQLPEIQKLIDNNQRANAIKEIIPKVEKLGGFLNSLNHRIKYIEASENERGVKNRKTLKALTEIRQKASSQYDDFNKRFLNVVTIKSQTQLQGGPSQELNSSEEGVKAQQQMLADRKTTQSSLSSLKSDIKQLRQEDLELILKISNQTMQISQEMKNSLARSEGSINTLEANVLDIKENLKNANKETTKLYNNNDSSICNYVWFLITVVILVIALGYFVYYELTK